MSLYLCVFDGDEELAGVDVGGYDDYGHFLDAVIYHLESRTPGSRYPLLTIHSDSDGEWSAAECAVLQGAFKEVTEAFRKLPPAQLTGWQTEVAKSRGIQPRTLYDCFFDVDGQPLLSRLIELCEAARKADRAIVFP
jgi:hypothetical protein